MIKRPDEYGHNNPDYAMVDAGAVRGGGRVVANLAALYAIPLDLLKERVTKVYVTAETITYVLKDIANYNNANGWEVESSGGAYTHPSTHPTTILDGVDAANGAEDYYLNKKGEFKRVEAGSSETGLTIRAKLEALAGDDKLNYTALKGVVSSYTLDFRDDVTQVQDINIEGAIRIDAIQTVNVATLQLGAVTLTLPLSAPITIAQGAYNIWTITRNNASAASVGIKYTKL